ncbi:uncharacterized protein [Acropora muricata]|uniref:uncharacterized protein n=1 Tax=Acropora muricata TaxID=159855 RepID=UPI0034E4F061
MADEAASAEENRACTKTSKRKLKRLQVEAASKLRCEVCPDKKFTSLKMYDDHMASKKHLKKKRKKETTDAWICGACDLTLSSQKEWTKHLVGQRHHSKLEEWGAKLFTTSSPVTQQEIESLDDSQFEEIEDD